MLSAFKHTLKASVLLIDLALIVDANIEIANSQLFSACQGNFLFSCLVSFIQYANASLNIVVIFNGFLVCCFQALSNLRFGNGNNHFIDFLIEFFLTVIYTYSVHHTPRTLLGCTYSQLISYLKRSRFRAKGARRTKT